MENIERDVSLSQSIEYVDAICLDDKRIILPDGCTTATLTTADGEALPVTFIVSQHLQESSEINNQPLEETITSESCDIIPDKDTDCIDVENINEEPPAVYAVHFPSDVKEHDHTPDFLQIQESDSLSEGKSSIIQENSLDHDLLDVHSDIEPISTITRLEDFMDVVTTYKCKFCRFSCAWKSGLMSHIRCCHINEKKSIVTLKAEKDKLVSSSSDKQKEELSLHDENCNSLPKIENELEDESCNDSEVNVKKEKEMNKLYDSFEVESDGKHAATDAPVVERHIFLCGQCSDGFASLEDCKQHMIDDHNLKLEQNNAKPVRKRGRPRTRPCADTINQSDGNTDVSGTRENKRHCRPPKNLEEDYDYGVKRKIRRESITDKIFRCTRSGCGHRFSSEANLHYHYTCHSENVKSFMCRECHDEFHHWRALAMHLWKEHAVDVDLHSCTECNYKTYSYFKLDNHRKIHSDERAFVCPTCHKGFKQVSQLRNHLVIHLDRKNLPEKRWYSEQECDTCGRKFSDAKCLRKHQQAVHSKLKPYICSYCGHLSARKAMLELHMRQHTGEKPFLCEHCDYRTGDHNSLRRHRMRHTGAKPYKCPHCPYACIQAISYKTHLRNKHPGMEGLFSCTICTFKSVSKENYVNHMSDHKRQAETLVENSTNITSDSEIPLDSLSAPDQSPIQMQLSDNTMQQLEGILDLNAAQLVCSCLNALSQDGGTLNLPPGVTVNIPPFSSSADGTQTITIQLPTGHENENEPYYLAIQQQDGTTALVLPSSTEQNDVQEMSVQENAELENVQFVEQDVTGSTSLDCGVLQGDNEGSQLHSGNSDSLVIAHIEPFDDPESFSTEVMTTSEDNQNSS